MSDYETLREANIKANKELLISLGLEAPLIPAKPRVNAKKAPAKNKKRKAVEPLDDAGQPPAKANKVATNSSAADSEATPGRRSARNAGKPKVDYNTPPTHPMDSPLAKNRTPQMVSAAAIADSGRENVGNRLGKRIHDPKRYGAIPGIEVGTWWETRAECSTDAIHAPFVAGIAGSAIEGAYSVALSGGYDDDVDLGYAFTYTGSGGRDLKGTKANPKNLRTAPQSSDQDFDNPMNAALQKSAETKKPVRVIRGYKLKSSYAPASGYRYDGLYRVEKAWRERGLNKEGFKVCKYAFKRIDGQPPLPGPEEEIVEDAGQVSAESEDEDKNEDEAEENGGEAEGDADGQGEADTDEA